MKPADSQFKVAQLPRSAEVMEIEASDWLALRSYRPLTAEEQSAFDAWLAADPRHAVVVTEFEAAWRALDGLGAYPRQTDEPANPEYFARPRRFRRVQWLALGAAAAIACAFILKLTPWSQPAAAPATAMATAVQHDAVRILRLSDGSLVELRAGSEVEEQFVATERRVRLVRGEAYFSVVKNPARPFIVDANGVAVRAVGTAFNVRLDPGSVVVLVTEGKVKVNSPAAPASAPSAAPVVEAQLGAGQRAVVSIADTENRVPPVVETVSAAEIKQALAWQGGLVFDATPLSQVIFQFNRRNVRQLVIVEPELGALRISGRFRADSVDGFAELMESSFGVMVTSRGNDLLLSKHP